MQRQILRALNSLGVELQGKKKTYTGTRLHRVAQVAAEVSGLVLCLVAAGQLGQALNNNNNNDKLVKPQL